MKPSLVGISRSELNDLIKEIVLEPKQITMRTNQIWQWLYLHGCTDFEQMLNIPKDLRNILKSKYTLDRPKIITEQTSNDGVIKWLLEFSSSNNNPSQVECVYIPEENRGTLCISSQVGCVLNCSFCHTGTQKLVRNLTSQEIVAQIIIAKDTLNDFPKNNNNNFLRIISNIVFMGMGEPLYNFPSLTKALNIMTDDHGLSLSKRKITVSTAGVVPEIDKLAKINAPNTPPMLAISLHATNNELRNKLVPINKKYPIEQLLDACKRYSTFNNARRITFEYVMLKDINDSKKDAIRLSKLLKDLPAKINIIPFNPWPNAPYECSSWSTIEEFSDILFRSGYASPIRMPRGQDILAACGQLKSATEKNISKKDISSII